MKTNPLQRTFRYLGIFPAIFSLGACGLPDGGERPHSTAMTGDDRR